MIKISIVIPVYNSEKLFEKLFYEIKKSTALLNQQHGYKFELILVNDASTDGVWNIIKKLSVDRYLTVFGINLLHNVGQFRAILCGLEHASGDYIITMDDDLQHPPAEISKLIKCILINPNYDCVIGAYDSKKHTIYRNIGSFLYNTIINKIYKIPNNIKRSSFRIFSNHVARALINYKTVNPILGPMIYKVTKRIKNVVIKHDKRISSKSNYSNLSLLKQFSQTIFFENDFVFRLFIFFGFLASLISLLLILFFFYKWINGYSVRGFTATVSLIVFYGGMLILGLGFTGLFMVRLFKEISHPHKYTILEKIDFKN